MKFGIIGAGPIGQNIAKKLVNEGHEVKVADARGLEYLDGKEIVGSAVRPEEVIQFIDVLILSVPIHVLPSLCSLLEECDEGVIIVDTSNYYPFRNNQIDEIQNGVVESVWVTNQLGRSIIKAFNNQLAYTLETKGMARGAHGRIAMTVAGDNQAHKEVIMNVIDECGFDTVDVGSIADSWKVQPGTPAYCTELTKEETLHVLERANKEKSSLLRDQVIAELTNSSEQVDIVALNRKIYGV